MHVSFGEFEKHNQGIGSELLTKVGHDGKVLVFNGQGMIYFIQVEGKPHYESLGYGKWEVGKCSKIV